jgi:formylglycine-generating enzyme required for sulfatase activity
MDMKIPLCLLCGDLSITNIHVFLYIQQSISVAIHFTTHQPQVKLSMPAFEMDQTTVTVQQFKEYVDDTGYITDGEKYGWWQP